MRPQGPDTFNYVQDVFAFMVVLCALIVRFLEWTGLLSRRREKHDLSGTACQACARFPVNGKSNIH